MGKSPRHDVSSATTTKRSTAVLLLSTTALDTTWRTLVPGIAGTVAGLALDHMWHTTPVVTILGLVIGVIVSALLIRAQFKAVNK